jgi:tRNA G18 (ribose-2'-O)-methylase SpoU
MREKTRRERYEKKKQIAKTYPISVATINFMHDGNLGYIIRSAACFGAKCVHVIGSVPDKGVLNPSSGTLCDYVDIKQYSNPGAFLEYARENDYNLISAEINNEATPLNRYKFNFSKHTCIVLGHEESGVPIELIRNSDTVFIPMPGVGYCLNTSQAGNIMLYEAAKAFEVQSKFLEEWVDECYIHHP